MPRLSPFLLALVSLAACALPSPQQDSARDALQLADTLKEKGNLSDAAGLYANAIRQGNAPASAYIALADIQAVGGAPQEAAETLKAGAMRYPGDRQLIGKLGYALIAAGQPQDAAAAFDSVIAAEPGNAAAYNGKAVALDNLGSHEAAQQMYRKGLALAPSAVAIHNNLAMSLMLSGATDDAIALLEKVSNANATTRQNLALAYGIKGDDAKALDLNLRDMAPGQAEKNQQFYDYYSKHAKEAKPAAVPQIPLPKPEPQPLPITKKLPLPAPVSAMLEPMLD